MQTSFFSEEEVADIGFKSVGKNVLISRRASIYNPEKIVLGNNVRIDDFCILSGEISLGSFVHVAAYSGLFGQYGIIMDDFTGCSIRTTLLSATDDFSSGNYHIGPTVPEKYRNVTYGTVVLKKHSHIGTGSVIMPGVTLNEGSAIGAMSFVIKDTKPWMLYRGNPARILGKRDKGVLELEDIVRKEFL